MENKGSKNIIKHEVQKINQVLVRRATHPDSDGRLVAQFRRYHSLGFIKERDERLGSLLRVTGVGAKSGFFLRAEGR